MQLRLEWAILETLKSFVPQEIIIELTHLEQFGLDGIQSFYEIVIIDNFEFLVYEKSTTYVFDLFVFFFN